MVWVWDGWVELAWWRPIPLNNKFHVHVCIILQHASMSQTQTHPHYHPPYLTPIRLWIGALLFGGTAFLLTFLIFHSPTLTGHEANPIIRELLHFGGWPVAALWKFSLITVWAYSIHLVHQYPNLPFIFSNPVYRTYSEYLHATIVASLMWFDTTWNLAQLLHATGFV